MELAVQLPEDVGQARAILERTAEVLEVVLVRAPHELWNMPAIEVEHAADSVKHEQAFVWTLLLLAVLAPIGALAARILDCEDCSGWILLGGVVVTSLAFGQLYGVLFSLGSGFAHNLLAVPPILEFSEPTRYEIVRLTGCLLLSVSLPAIANAAPYLRGLVLNGRSFPPLAPR
jgi:hypothetical protein